MTSLEILIERRRDRLVRKRLPISDGRSWLAVLRELCERYQVRMDDVLAGKRSMRGAAAKRGAWWEISDVGRFSAEEIAEVWEVDASVIVTAIRRARAERQGVKDARKFGGTGT